MIINDLYSKIYRYSSPQFSIYLCCVFEHNRLGAGFAIFCMFATEMYDL